jgi:hypothetical protein
MVNNRESLKTAKAANAFHGEKRSGVFFALGGDAVVAGNVVEIVVGD